jgi:hypothetical protein
MKEAHMEDTRKPARKPRAAAAPKSARKKGATSGKATVRKPVGIPSRAAIAPPPATEREELVRTAAYYRAERRGFAPGYEWEDWLAAEAEVSALTGRPPTPKPRKAPARKPKPG